MHNITVVIPAYNEELRVVSTLESLHRFLETHATNYEVIIVDDGSKDRTSDVALKAMTEWPQARLITMPANEGKGAAIRLGVLAATKENLCFMDADGSTDFEMFHRLFEKLGSAQPVVIGSRDVAGAQILVHQSWLREYAAKFFNLWIQLWLLPGVRDTQCGFKMFRTQIAQELFEPLIEKRFGFDIEILYRAKKKGYSILEIPVRWTNVLNSRVNPVRDGLAMAWQVMRTRFII